MKYFISCNCINILKACSNLTKIYETVLGNVKLKNTQVSTLRKFQKRDKSSISDLSRFIVLHRTTVPHNIKKLIKLDLVSYKYINNSKDRIIQLTTIGKNKLREAITI